MKHINYIEIFQFSEVKWNSLTLQVLKGFLQESQTVNKVKISL